MHLVQKITIVKCKLNDNIKRSLMYFKKYTAVRKAKDHSRIMQLFQKKVTLIQDALNLIHVR